MELYIPHIFSNNKARKPWFNSARFRAAKDREAAHKPYRSHQSAETHALYTSARNHAKSILQIIKNLFINRKCQNLLNSNSSRDFCHLTNSISSNFTLSSFPPLLQPDGSKAVYSFSKAELLLKSLLSILLWIILGIFLLLLHHLATSSLN